MPDATLEAFYDHGEVGDPMPADGGDCDALLARFAQAGVDTAALATKLQNDGAKSFVDSWNDLLARITAQGGKLS
jgi:transaldolase